MTAVSNANAQSYSYDTIGNITTMNGNSYTYGDSDHAHAVTTVGTTSYAYDDNGNMTDRGDQDLTWDVENMVTSIDDNGDITTFIYDGNGNRVKKIIHDGDQDEETILYINLYYEKNLTTGVVTTSYYLGGKLIAQREDTTLTYIHQDSLSSTSLTTDGNGDQSGSTMKYLPFGACRNSQQEIDDLGTDKLFTGQRLDDSGLYYYNARYYDPLIGRFISADTIVSEPFNPQNLNRYSYCLNNPLKYVDPSGHDQIIEYQGLNSNDAPWWTICDGQGNLVGIATGWDELNQKMEALKTITDDVYLPLSDDVVNFRAVNDLPNRDGTQYFKINSIRTGETKYVLTNPSEHVPIRSTVNNDYPYYVGTSFSGGILGIGGTIGIVLDNDGNLYWYRGIGLSTPGITVSLSLSVDEVTEGLNTSFEAGRYIYFNTGNSLDAIDQDYYELGLCFPGGVSYMWIDVDYITTIGGK